MTAIWREYDREALDFQYAVRDRVPNALELIAQGTEASEAARRDYDVRMDQAYGDSAGQTVNVFPAAAAGSPVFIFIHGGYWQRLDKNDYDFVARPFVEAGAAVVNVNYDLAPTVTMDEIVRQVRAAVLWTWQNAGSFNGDRKRIHVSGHSAGGHLTAMVACTDWPALATDVPANLVKSGHAISGLFDLEPIRLCHLNDAVRMDEAAAARNSPMLLAGANNAPLVLAVGGAETDEFLRQQTDYAAALKEAGRETPEIVQAGCNHFDVLFALTNEGEELHQSVRRALEV
jgi:arylformamidase